MMPLMKNTECIFVPPNIVIRLFVKSSGISFMRFVKSDEKYV